MTPQAAEFLFRFADFLDANSTHIQWDSFRLSEDGTLSIKMVGVKNDPTRGQTNFIAGQLRKHAQQKPTQP